MATSSLLDILAALLPSATTPSPTSSDPSITAAAAATAAAPPLEIDELLFIIPGAPNESSGRFHARYAAWWLMGSFIRYWWIYHKRSRPVSHGIAVCVIMFIAVNIWYEPWRDRLLATEGATPIAIPPWFAQLTYLVCMLMPFGAALGDAISHATISDMLYVVWCAVLHHNAHSLTGFKHKAILSTGLAVGVYAITYGHKALPRRSWLPRYQRYLLWTPWITLALSVFYRSWLLAYAAWLLLFACVYWLHDNNEGHVIRAFNRTFGHISFNSSTLAAGHQYHLQLYGPRTVLLDHIAKSCPSLLPPLVRLVYEYAWSRIGTPLDVATDDVAQRLACDAWFDTRAMRVYRIKATPTPDDMIGDDTWYLRVGLHLGGTCHVPLIRLPVRYFPPGAGASAMAAVPLRYRPVEPYDRARRGYYILDTIASNMCDHRRTTLVTAWNQLQSIDHYLRLTPSQILVHGIPPAPPPLPSLSLQEQLQLRARRAQERLRQEAARRATPILDLLGHDVATSPLSLLRRRYSDGDTANGNGSGNGHGSGSDIPSSPSSPSQYPSLSSSRSYPSLSSLSSSSSSSHSSLLSSLSPSSSSLSSPPSLMCEEKEYPSKTKHIELPVHNIFPPPEPLEPLRLSLVVRMQLKWDLYTTQQMQPEYHFVAIEPALPVQPCTLCISTPRISSSLPTPIASSSSASSSFDYDAYDGDDYDFDRHHYGHHHYHDGGNGGGELRDDDTRHHHHHHDNDGSEHKYHDNNHQRNHASL